MLNRHEALIHGMVIAAAADAVITESEMEMIGRIVAHLPVFRDFDVTQLTGSHLAGNEGLSAGIAA